MFKTWEKIVFPFATLFKMQGFCAFAFQFCEKANLTRKKMYAQKTEFNADFVDAG